MDSRLKIVDSLPAGRAFHVLRGYFDPLLASHARALAACPRPLAVQVLDPENPLLPLAARQLLVAALASVECVLTPQASLEAVEVEDWRDRDNETRDAFIRHVHDRHQKQTA